jgi:hypothetical protein
LNGEWWGFHISHVGSLWQDLSFGTMIFDLLTLALKFDLLLKNFNNSHIFWMVIYGDLMFHILVLCDKTFLVPFVKMHDPWPLSRWLCSSSKDCCTRGHQCFTNTSCFLIHFVLVNDYWTFKILVMFCYCPNVIFNLTKRF